eukprot:Lithocolla_globosa_v1_NODE_613_length_3597_cov_230.357506.p2 type:complete len:315 gc:universal NODE_613_length_3597_cov_230.357506:782-1726(+)
MLLLQEGLQKHYILIKNLSRLISSQTSKHKGKTYYCKMCLSQFQKEDNLTNHIEVCKLLNEDKSKSILPKEGENTFKFKNHANVVPDPFVIYADFESFIQEKVHTANSFAYKVVCHIDPTRTRTIKLKHSNPVEFMDMIEYEVESIMDIYRQGRDSPIILSQEEQHQYDNTDECLYCKCQIATQADLDHYDYVTKTDLKVRDHCHVTGKFRGASCYKCNLKARTPRNVPIVFHNLKGYDGHLIIKNLKKYYGIPNTEEKYMSFTIGQMKFIDSFQFLSSSLSKLVDNLYEDGKGLRSSLKRTLSSHMILLDYHC